MTGQKPARNQPEPLTQATINLGNWLSRSIGIKDGFVFGRFTSPMRYRSDGKSGKQA